jgi:surfeit locus 1 family protein
MKALGLMFSRRWILATLLVFAGSAVLVRLGIWQLDRLAQQRAFNAHYLETSALPRLVIKSAPSANITQMEYRPVEVTGVYDPAHQVELRNQYHENQPGYFLLTPLVLADGTAILIERGWIPAAGNATPQDWRQYDQPGTLTVRGSLRLGETQPEMGGVPDPTLAPGQTHLDQWNIVNVERIALQLPYKMPPVFVQPDPDPALAAPPYPYQPEIVIDEGSHFSYALQWFTFAIILFFGYPLFYLRKVARMEEK